VVDWYYFNNVVGRILLSIEKGHGILSAVREFVQGRVALARIRID
jgi:hypothetical protein